MHGDTPITSLNNQSKGQKQQTIPVAALADGARLLIENMRLWKKLMPDTLVFSRLLIRSFLTITAKGVRALFWMT